ncbi:unnamed protein product [Ostreobium quekettii]|uniref:Serine aminopeptidase S33 domain-containing protein n=1 Tax=Ostreobium quekettii TaxID=121088 RepID=A0A8S1JCJ9_9CHLO|nr:unnamed protein product [Ostreobium quekettii]|eukprot:evm.model.scf_1899.3 EVM.evm.TU.scf_1899.3   scf_1899:26324-27370(-)
MSPSLRPAPGRSLSHPDTLRFRLGIGPQGGQRARPRAQILPRMALNDGGRSVEQFRPSILYPDLRVLERTWEPSAGAPKGGLLMVHGGMWHSGWFGPFGDAVCDAAGVRVTALDLPSHGKSDDIEGYRGYTSRFKDFVEEAGATLDRLRASLPDGAPVAVLGESMGGLVTLLLALEPGVAEKIRGLVLLAPLIRPAAAVMPPKPVVAVVKLIGRLFPRLVMPGNELSGESFDLAFGDAEVAEMAKRDPLVQYGEDVRIGTMAGALSACDELESRFGELAVGSVVVLQNEGDVRTEIARSEDMLGRIGRVRDRELVRLPGTAHQLFQDAPGVREENVARVAKVVRKMCA